jgi:hypothetical protein
MMVEEFEPRRISVLVHLEGLQFHPIGCDRLLVFNGIAFNDVARGYAVYLNGK